MFTAVSKVPPICLLKNGEEVPLVLCVWLLIACVLRLDSERCSLAHGRHVLSWCDITWVVYEQSGVSHPPFVFIGLCGVLHITVGV